MGRHSRGHRNANGSALAHVLDMHGLFACNTAFDHPARHRTTWQGQRRDAATNQVVPVYNMIEFVLCHQSHMSLLQDARSYGTKLSSDHCLVIVRANTSCIFGVCGKSARTTVKSIRYDTQQLSNPIIRLKYQLYLAQNVTDLSAMANQCRNNHQMQMQFTLLHNLQLELPLQLNTISTISAQSWHRCLLSKETDVR